MTSKSKNTKLLAKNTFKIDLHTNMKQDKFSIEKNKKLVK